MTGAPVLVAGLLSEAGLQAPAPAGVKALAEFHLAQVRAARARLGQPEDREALHDFRVALRRLRSVLRAYRPVVRGIIGRRILRRLRRVSRASNRSRDLEVKLGWLALQETDLRPRDRIGLRWLARRLEAAKTKADRRVGAAITDRLEPLTVELDEQLLEVARTAAPGQPIVARVTGERLRGFLDAFQNRLAGVRTMADQARAHRARIAGKRVRYLLEPLIDVLPEAGELVARYKQLQDLLGDMHDADVLAGAIAEAMEDAATERGRRVAERVREGEPLDRAALRRERRRDPMPGLLALAGLVQERKERDWAAFETDWLARRDDLLVGPAARIADRLALRPAGGLEIERKYLLRELPAQVREALVEEIDQGYLPGERIQERVRRVREGDVVRWTRTLKDGTGMVRTELEEDTSADVFEALWSLTEGHRVRKRRYRMEENGLVWEVDEFTDRDLVLAEVELDAPDREVALPEWLAPHVVREVTEEPEFLNVNLAR